MPKVIDNAPLSHRDSISAATVASGSHTRDSWVAKDDETLLRARAQGLNWNQIAPKHFPSKSPNACRKRHETLMERQRAEQLVSDKSLDALAEAYMESRREMWSILSARVGEKWQVVEQKCMEKGIKNLNQAFRSANRQSKTAVKDEDADSAIIMPSENFLSEFLMDESNILEFLRRAEHVEAPQQTNTPKVPNFANSKPLLEQQPALETPPFSQAESNSQLPNSMVFDEFNSQSSARTADKTTLPGYMTPNRGKRKYQQQSAYMEMEGQLNLSASQQGKKPRLVEDEESIDVSYGSTATPNPGNDYLDDTDGSETTPTYSRKGKAKECTPEKPGPMTGDVAKSIDLSLPESDFSERFLLPEYSKSIDQNWHDIQALLPESWRWDVEYQTNPATNGGTCGCWTCTPLEANEPRNYPLTIAGAPVVLPLDFRWPPMAGVTPPPDPRPSIPIDARASISLDLIRDVFLTFEGSIGVYILISGILQIIVPDEFDIVWASSHLPHKYGGLKVCYVRQTLEPTMRSSSTETLKLGPLSPTQDISSPKSMFRPLHSGHTTIAPSLKLNSFIEVRGKSIHAREKYSGRIGLRVSKNDEAESYLIMTSHIIIEAILAKSLRELFLGRGRDPFKRLRSEWNDHVEIWAGGEKIGTIAETYDPEAETYPSGFQHDITLVKANNAASVKDVCSPIPNLGWLNRESWASLRQQTSTVKILESTESHRSAKTFKCSRPSDILIVGEGIFLNQTAGADAKSLRDHDISDWNNLVSRALLYRVNPDFDPPTGYSGVALYAEGTRLDGTVGPGIVGFQSFVQRSPHIQNFAMEGSQLERRLRLGRIAFYGAFQVPEKLKSYSIM